MFHLKMAHKYLAISRIQNAISVIRPMSKKRTPVARILQNAKTIMDMNSINEGA